MKKVFAIALAAFVLAACQNSKNNAGTASQAAEGSKIETVYDIAYIQMDSLVTGYKRFVDLSAAFETKATKVQNDLEARARRLQNEMVDLETKAGKGLMTRSDIETTQMQLQTKAQQFDNDRQNQLASLAEEEQVMTNQVMYAIQQYVAKFNSGLRYKMILTSTGSAPVMHADPALNITAEILKGLNEEYAAEKSANKK